MGNITTSIRVMSVALSAVAILLATTALAKEPPDLILKNGNVVTLDASSTTAQAVAVRGGSVLAVGSNKEIERLADSETHRIDLGGRTLIPGLSDSHVHASSIGAAAFADAQIGDARSIPEVLSIIREAVDEADPGEWVVVSGDLRHIRIHEGRYPTLDELDLVSPRNPLLVPTGHLSTANSLALEAAGINTDTPDPIGGTIGRDENGNLTGVLEGRAAAVVSRVIPSRETDISTAILYAQNRLLRMGITSLREPGVSPAVLKSYRELNSQDKLLIRTSIMLRPQGFDDEAVSLIESWGPERQGRDDMLSVWGVKLSVDGGLVLTNAGLMKEPYLDKPGYRGIQRTPTEALYRLVSAANRVGLPVGIHATGDAAMEIALDVLGRVSEEKSIRGQRFAIEHADLPTPRSLKAMRDLQVVASIQPSMLTTAPAVLLEQLGPERSDMFLPYQSFKQYGITMAGGSDAPAFESNPFHGIWSIVTREVQSAREVIAPDQVLSREDALRIYTQGGAYLTFEEDEKGSIEPGKFADFALLSDNIMTVDVDLIPEIHSVLTIVGGRVVYQKNSN